MKLYRKMNEMNRPFPRSNHEASSLLYFDCQTYFTTTVNTKAKVQKTKKLKNMKEVSNLYIAEHKETTDLAAVKHLCIGEINLLADYLLFKTNQRQGFNIIADEFEEYEGKIQDSEPRIGSIRNMIDPTFDSFEENQYEDE